MADSPHRRKDPPQKHVIGRYRTDAPPPDQRGSPDDWVGNPYRLLLRGLLIAALIVAAITAVAVFLLTRPPAIPGGNAVWLGIRWGEDPHPDDEVQTLTRTLQVHGIDTAYVWLSYLQADDTWTEAASANMALFVGQFKRFYPEANLYAWVSFPTRLPDDRMADEDVRAEIARYCQQIITDFGFDGVHLNAEPIVNQDDNFPTLLRAIRAAIGPDAALSVTVPPDPLAYPDLIWDVEYKQRVALLADEIVVMAYNSGLSSPANGPADYEAWMAAQVNSFVAAIAALEGDVNTHLIFGIPTYDAEPNHDPAVETVGAAITGIQRGLEGVGEENAVLVSGLGVYAYWSTDATEWLTYRQLWLGLE